VAIGFCVGNIIDEIGASAFVYAFFSTISRHLEPNGWGTKYPELMNELYRGRLHSQHAQKVLNDVREIRNALKTFPPSAVVWDYEKPDASPPWGDEISDEITDLSNYFVTSTGRDVIDVLIDCLEALQEEGGVMSIEQI
jgi:2,3-bisphosphoglycerate-dependent phosphoglycerate mutase